MKIKCIEPDKKNALLKISRTSAHILGSKSSLTFIDFSFIFLKCVGNTIPKFVHLFTKHSYQNDE